MSVPILVHILAIALGTFPAIALAHEEIGFAAGFLRGQVGLQCVTESHGQPGYVVEHQAEVLPNTRDQPGSM